MSGPREEARLSVWKGLSHGGDVPTPCFFYLSKDIAVVGLVSVLCSGHTGWMCWLLKRLHLSSVDRMFYHNITSSSIYTSVDTLIHSQMKLCVCFFLDLSLFLYFLSLRQWVCIIWRHVDGIYHTCLSLWRYCVAHCLCFTWLIMKQLWSCCIAAALST